MPPMVLFLLLGVGSVLTWWRPVDLLPTAVSVSVGTLLVVAAVGLFLWATRLMTQADTGIPPTEPTTAIIEDGPFGWSRNPIYVAMLLLMVGIGTLVDGPWFVGLAALFLGLLQWGVVSREEAYLTQKFGQPYVDYCSRVRRWL
ncbi:MAG: isoprenylcysteine carboxylmethyltransferase family protein [Myxococcota bacterium]